MDLSLIAFLLALGALVGFAVIQRGPQSLPGQAPETQDKALPGPKAPDITLKEVKPDAQAKTSPQAPAQTAAKTPAKPAAQTPAQTPAKTPAKPAAQTSAKTAAKPAGKAPRSQAESYKAGLGATRKGFVARLDKLLRGAPKVDATLRDEVETLLFTADIGARTAQNLMDSVSDTLDRKELKDPQLVWQGLRTKAQDIVSVPSDPLEFAVDPKPYVLLAVGVNGVGKTTTLAKLAALHQSKGRKVLLVAGDTFRAAATEQLQSWGERLGIPVHAGAAKADPAGVIFDGIKRGRKEGFDLVLCDTAGRLHTKKELMAELEKIHRSAAKALSSEDHAQQAHDTFLVLDATIGQNAVAQAELFTQATQCTGIVVTKLDGTAKGGVVLGICDQMKIPIRYLGVGEGVEDLRDFEPQLFVDTLFTPPDAQPLA